MHATIKRVVVYVAAAVMLFAVATFFVESQLGFVVTFGMGFLIVVAAELMFWVHAVRLFTKRRRQ
jgi:hypothetical protein